ncbi:MAG: indolepyruvate ferredoxin oxidoreductase [Bacteroidales bacterium]|nr:indolepyruvate ferredoxin oxidoreductase [Bacteroidales bacterium]
MEEKILLLGAEAIAQGAIDAGISGIYAYPGTPSTEITEYVQRSKEAKKRNIHSTWSANEKTAYEAALGMAYAGKRAMVCMKHVGLNVAADAFINSAITGTNGGLIVTVADDPSMHSSQNEQDSRFYGKFAMIPVLEPSSQQEAYDAVHLGFELSEKVKLPVMLRITTRLSHSRAGIKRKNIKNQNILGFPGKRNQFILLPANARIQYQELIDKQPDLEEIAEHSVLNKSSIKNSSGLGVITFGIAYNYLMEVVSENNLYINILKIGQYPLPKKMTQSFIEKCSKVLVLEEGYPVYEELLRGFWEFSGPVRIHGRLDGTIPRTGELNPDIVRAALDIEKNEPHPGSTLVAGRPPELCQGCSHRDLYTELNEALKDVNEKHVFSDIGCYTLGALPPYDAINTCVDMGASVTMAKGAADAGLRPSVAVIGDSTFTHSGITGLLDAVNDKSAVTIIISDNATTAMTGGQDSPGFGRLYDICLGVGVEKEHLRVMEPLKKNFEMNVKVLKEEIAYEGVSVVISNRECIQTLTRKKRAQNKSEIVK